MWKHIITQVCSSPSSRMPSTTLPTASMADPVTAQPWLPGLPGGCEWQRWQLSSGANPANGDRFIGEACGVDSDQGSSLPSCMARLRLVCQDCKASCAMHCCCQLHDDCLQQQHTASGPSSAPFSPPPEVVSFGCAGLVAGVGALPGGVWGACKREGLCSALGLHGLLQCGRA